MIFFPYEYFFLISLEYLVHDTNIWFKKLFSFLRNKKFWFDQQICIWKKLLWQRVYTCPGCIENGPPESMGKKPCSSLSCAIIFCTITAGLNSYRHPNESPINWPYKHPSALFKAIVIRFIWTLDFPNYKLFPKSFGKCKQLRHVSLNMANCPSVWSFRQNVHLLLIWQDWNTLWPKVHKRRITSWPETHEDRTFLLKYQMFQMWNVTFSCK